MEINQTVTTTERRNNMNNLIIRFRLEKDQSNRKKGALRKGSYKAAVKIMNEYCLNFLQPCSELKEDECGILSIYKHVECSEVYNLSWRILHELHIVSHQLEKTRYKCALNLIHENAGMCTDFVLSDGVSKVSRGANNGIQSFPGDFISQVHVSGFIRALGFKILMLGKEIHCINDIGVFDEVEGFKDLLDKKRTIFRLRFRESILDEYRLINGDKFIFSSEESATLDAIFSMLWEKGTIPKYDSCTLLDRLSDCLGYDYLMKGSTK